MLIVFYINSAKVRLTHQNMRIALFCGRRVNNKAPSYLMWFYNIVMLRINHYKQKTFALVNNEETFIWNKAIHAVNKLNRLPISM